MESFFIVAYEVDWNLVELLLPHWPRMDYQVMVEETGYEI